MLRAPQHPDNFTLCLCIFLKLTSALERGPSILQTELAGRDPSNAHYAIQKIIEWVLLNAQTILRYAVVGLIAAFFGLD